MDAPVTNGIEGDELREVVTKVARHTISGVEAELIAAYAIPEGERSRYEGDRYGKRYYR